MVADATQVTHEPKAVRFFGQELVLYRGRASGRAVLLDAWCPHMGTHLARNHTSYVVRSGEQVDGDNIRCPFHRWRFGPDGHCNEIPYSTAPIPQAARIRSWRVVEIMGAVFAWHDPEDGEPDYEIPVLAEWNDPAWVRWTFDDLGVLACHPQEVVDNIVDAAHQAPVHGQDLIYFENEFLGHRVVQREGDVDRHTVRTPRKRRSQKLRRACGRRGHRGRHDENRHEKGDRLRCHRAHGDVPLFARLGQAPWGRVFGLVAHLVAWPLSTSSTSTPPVAFG